MDQDICVGGITTPVAPSYFGFVESISGTMLVGYIVNLRDVARQPSVRVLRDGHVLGIAKCDLFREDLLLKGVGDGCCGFRVAVDPPIHTLNGVHIVVYDGDVEVNLRLDQIQSGIVGHADAFEASLVHPGQQAVVEPVVQFKAYGEPDVPSGETDNVVRSVADALWCQKLWVKAEKAYIDYVALFPRDGVAWVRLAEAARATGNLVNAEGACRVAILFMATDPAVHLLHGRLLGDLGRHAEALTAFGASFRLLPLRGAAVCIEAAGGQLDLMLPPAGVRAPGLYLEISDLLHFMRDHQVVSGIQRVQVGIVSYVLDELSAAVQGQPCLVIWSGDRLYEVSPYLLVEIFAEGVADDFALKARRDRIDALRDGAMLVSFVSGDVVLITGSMWLPDVRLGVVRGHARLKRDGVRLGICFYDFIPLTDPEFCHPYLTERFSVSVSESLLHCDFALTISDHVAVELTRLLAASGYPAIPTVSVLLAHTFGSGQLGRGQTDGAWESSIADLQGVEYVLAVSSISAHKNHSLLLQVWRLLLHRGIEPPLLVIVGRRGFRSDELFQQLEATKYLDGRIRVIEDLDDAGLAQLYEGCLFTMFPSLTEGWGLPIGESLAHGKLCVASSTTSMPEVGGDFVVYIDPMNVRGCEETVARLLQDRELLRDLERRVVEGFKARTWDDFSRSLIAGAWQAGRGVSVHPSPVAVQLGQVMRPCGHDTGWHHGVVLPRYDDLARQVLLRTMLEFGWSDPARFGASMLGSRATLLLPIAAAPGSHVNVVLHLRATARARIDLRIVASTDRGPVATVLTGSGVGDAVLSVAGQIDQTGHLTLSIDVDQAAAPAEYAARLLLVRLMVEAAERPLVRTLVRSNQWFSVNGLVGDPGVAVPPYTRSMLVQAARVCDVLEYGWQQPGAVGAWMNGPNARVTFVVDAAIGARVLVAIRLSGRGKARLRILAVSDCGASVIISPHQVELSSFLVWLECVVGEERSVGIVLKVVETEVPWVRAAMQTPMAILGLAYGADQIGLVAALLFGRPTADLRNDLLQHRLRFVVSGHFKGSYSLASVNRHLALALESVSPGSVCVDQVEIKPVRELTGIPRAERVQLVPLAARATHSEGPVVVIAQHWPVLDDLPAADQRLAFVFWEESVAPADMVRRLNDNYSGVLVPARSVGKALIDSGVSLPVRTVGMAPDLGVFQRIGEQRAVQPPRRITAAKPFTFLHVSSCFPRKGADILLRAYLEAFRNGEHVLLTVKTFPNEHNEIEQQIEAARLANPAAPPIALVNRDLPLAEIVAHYAAADAMVLPTRGEGFNMPAAEALAAGLALIVTDFGGQADFVTADTARLIGYSFSASQSHLNSAGSVWVDPDVEHLAVLMREAFEAAGTPAESARIAAGRRAAVNLVDGVAWAQRVTFAAVDLLCGRQPSPPKIALVTTWGIRCGVAEYSRLLVKAYPNAARDIVIFCNDEVSLPEEDACRYPPVRVAWRNHNYDSIERLIVAIQESESDVVLIQHHLALIDSISLTLLLKDRRLATCHFVITLHNVEDLFSDSVSLPCFVEALASASRILVHTVRDLNLLRKRGLVNNVSITLHGVTPIARAALTPRALPMTAAPLIGGYGFLLPHKGVGRLIEAFSLIRNSWPLARLRLVTAEYPNDTSAVELLRCRELVRKLGLIDAVEWHTEFLPDEESLALLHGCDLLVLPYNESSESSSAAIRTALGSRVPVAVTPVRIFDDVSKLVFRFDGFEPQVVAGGIAWILRSQPDRHAVQIRTAQWLADNDWGLLAERLRGMLTGLVAQGRPYSVLADGSQAGHVLAAP